MDFSWFCRWWYPSPLVQTWRKRRDLPNPSTFGPPRWQCMNLRAADGDNTWNPCSATILAVLESSSTLSGFPTISPTCFQLLEGLCCEFKIFSLFEFIFKFWIFMACKYVIVVCLSKNIIKQYVCVFAFYFILC